VALCITANRADHSSRWPFDLARTKATECGEAEWASTATGRSFTFALVAKDLLFLPIESGDPNPARNTACWRKTAN
jgi:hypothetical protein